MADTENIRPSSEASDELVGTNDNDNNIRLYPVYKKQNYVSNDCEDQERTASKKQLYLKSSIQEIAQQKSKQEVVDENPYQSL